VRTGVQRRDRLEEVARWEAADLATGERAVVQVAGDVVLEAPGARLVDLDP
jgi:alkylhydroperoxidase family enzyme